MAKPTWVLLRFGDADGRTSTPIELLTASKFPGFFGKSTFLAQVCKNPVVELPKTTSMRQGKTRLSYDFACKASPPAFQHCLSDGMLAPDCQPQVREHFVYIMRKQTLGTQP